MPLQLLPVYNHPPRRIMELYKNSFPEYERRTWSDQVLLVEEKKVMLLELVLDNVFAGCMFYWPLSDFIFIEHFAIHTDCRGKGTGTLAMQMMKEQYSMIVLETEPAIQNTAATRRIQFYENLGFKIFPFPYQQPPYHPGNPPINMHLMHNSHRNTATGFEKIKNEIYQTVYQLPLS